MASGWLPSSPRPVVSIRVEADPFARTASRFMRVESVFVSGGTFVSHRIGRSTATARRVGASSLDLSALSPRPRSTIMQTSPRPPPSLRSRMRQPASSPRPSGGGIGSPRREWNGDSGKRRHRTTGTVPPTSLTRIDLTGTPLSNADLAAILDPKPAQVRRLGGAAEEILTAAARSSIPELVERQFGGRRHRTACQHDAQRARSTSVVGKVAAGGDHDRKDLTSRSTTKL